MQTETNSTLINTAFGDKTSDMLAGLNSFRHLTGKAPLASWKNSKEALKAAIENEAVLARSMVSTAKNDITEIVNIETAPTEEVNEVGQAAPQEEPVKVHKVGASDIIRKYMLSGNKFIREELIQEVHDLDRSKDKKVILNTVGALMSTMQRKLGLIKHIEKNESKIAVFWYTMKANEVGQAAPQEAAPMVDPLDDHVHDLEEDNSNAVKMAEQLGINIDEMIVE